MHLAAAAGLAPHTAHGQDAARLAADHARQGQLAQVERAAQVHVQHVLPLLRGDIGEQLLLGNARVAHQHIHMAHGLLHGVERHLTAGAGGHIALDRQQARQLLFQRRRRVVCLGLVVFFRLWRCGFGFCFGSGSLGVWLFLCLLLFSHWLYLLQQEDLWFYS